MLELSYNEIRSLAPLSSLAAAQLSELYAASNKVTRIEGISQLTGVVLAKGGGGEGVYVVVGVGWVGAGWQAPWGWSLHTTKPNPPTPLCAAAGLQVLELGSNRIRCIENLETLAGLRELWLGRNRIAEISDMQRCAVHVSRGGGRGGGGSAGAAPGTWLRHKKSQRSNRGCHLRPPCMLLAWPCIPAPTHASACPASPPSLLLCCAAPRSLTSLKRLSLQSNRLTSMAGLGACTALEELYLSHNGIQQLEVGGGGGRG